MRNRICGSVESSGSLDKLQASQNITQQADRTDLEHQVCFFGPERYEPRYEYPLVVWLHSCHSSEYEIENIMPELSLQNYVACAPRGTNPCDDEGKFFRWGQSAGATAIAEEIVFESIELAQQQFSIAPKRVFLAGFGGGGTMAWRIGLRYPQRFAGIVSVCGQFPHRNQPLLNLERARDLPSLWLYGAQSKDCGVSQVCETLPVMHSASLSVDIRQYSGGDELMSNMLVDVNAWVMEQVTRQPASTEPTRVESFSRN